MSSMFPSKTYEIGDRVRVFGVYGRPSGEITQVCKNDEGEIIGYKVKYTYIPPKRHGEPTGKPQEIEEIRLPEDLALIASKAFQYCQCGSKADYGRQHSDWCNAYREGK